MEDEEYIAHYGVKGMRWGVRTKSGSSRAAKKRRGSSESRKSTLTRRARGLSDDDLKQRIARMELEKKYVDLSRGTSGSGKKFARDVIESSGKTVVGAAVGGTAGYLVQRELKKRLPS